MVQSDPMGMVACINEYKFQNPGPAIIGILSHAGVREDLQLIRNVNSVQRDVSFVVGGHSHEPFFEAKRGRCLKTEFNATLQQTFCECAHLPCRALLRVPLGHSVNQLRQLQDCIKLRLQWCPSCSTSVVA